MPRINGNSPSSSPIAPRGNETPRHGNQGSSNTKHRSILGSIGAALGGIGRSRKSSSSGSASASPPRGAAPGTPPREQTTHAPIDTLKGLGVDLGALNRAIGLYLSQNIALPTDFKAALRHAGVNTAVDFHSGEPLINHPLMALSHDIHRELNPRRPAATPARPVVTLHRPAATPAQPAATPARPAGLTRSQGLRRTEGDASPPHADQAALEALNQAGIDPHEFNTAVSNYVSYGNDLPAPITAFLQNAGIRHHISTTEALNPSHPLLAFDRQVRVALRNQTPAAPRSRSAGNTPGGLTPARRRTTPTPAASPAPLNSADFDQSAVFAAPPRNVGAR